MESCLSANAALQKTQPGYRRGSMAVNEGLITTCKCDVDLEIRLRDYAKMVCHRLEPKVGFI